MKIRPRGLAERLEIGSIVEDAYAPLRSRRAELSPLRVRAAVRWGRGAPPSAARWSRTVSRLSELSVAVGMSVMVFVAAFSPSPARSVVPAVDEARDPAYAVPRVTVPLEDAQYIRWLRLDRYVPVQDWLDPTVVRAGAARGPRLELPAPTTPNEPY